MDIKLLPKAEIVEGEFKEKKAGEPDRGLKVISGWLHAGWILLVILLTASIASLAIGWWQDSATIMVLSVVLFSLAGTYFGFCFKEIKDPHVAIWFKTGKYAGALYPGWYLTIPGVIDITLIPTDWQTLTMTGNTYIGGDKSGDNKTLIDFEVAIVFRAKESELEKILLMLPDEMIERAKAGTLTAVRGVLGDKSFGTIVSCKGDIEKQLKKLIAEEFEPYGYEIRECDIVDYNEHILSEAAKTRKIGEAEADVIAMKGKAKGEEIKSFSSELKGNPSAAFVAAAISVANALSGRDSGKKKPKTEE